MTFANINLDTNFSVLVPCAFTKMDLNFFLQCPHHSNHHRDLLNRISDAVDIDLGNLSSTILCNLLLSSVIPVFALTLIASLLSQHYSFNPTFQADLDKPSCSHLQRLCFLFTVHVFLFCLCSLFTFFL